MTNRLLAIMVVLLCAKSAAAGETGNYSKERAPRVTICSQNLERYGSPRIFARNNPGKKSGFYEAKLGALLARFVTAQCDVIAVQEVLGKDRREAQESIDTLAGALSVRASRTFRGFVGESNDNFIRVGFLVGTDRLAVLGAEAFPNEELPRLLKRERPQFFLRIPFEISLKGARPFKIVTFHFKSKSGGTKDPAGYMWETTRMKSAEKLREMLRAREKDSFDAGTVPLFVLGDRNSDEGSASQEILAGRLQLSQFQGPDPVCGLAKSEEPVCTGNPRNAPILNSVVAADPDARRLHKGTHYYRKKASWLDDILVPRGTLPLVLEDASRAGDYESGVIDSPKEASDHALVYVRAVL